MGTVFILRATTLTDALIGERRLWSLPIRIGRNALNDFQLTDYRVSDFHAIIEEWGERPCIRDIYSAYGVSVRFAAQSLPSRLPPQTLVDLSTCGYQFALGGAVFMQLRFEQTSELAPRSTGRVGAVIGNRELLRGPSGTVMLPRASTPPASAPPRGRTPLPPTLAMNTTEMPGSPATGDARAAAWMATESPRGLGFEALPVPQGASEPTALPSLGPAAHFHSTDAPSAYGPPPAPSPNLDARPPVNTAHFGLSLESLAIQALRELAASLLPTRSLETTGDLARFVTKLNDMAEVFCRCFLPLREGHQQFISSLDLQRAAQQRGRNASPAALAVEFARSPEELALALLDFREQSLDAPKAIEGIFADLMIHQVALLDGLMQGVRALLQELSPRAIEQRVASQGAFGLDLGNARGKALWAAYAERYAELAEDERALLRIFGPEFTQAYRDYRTRRDGGS